METLFPNSKITKKDVGTNNPGFSNPRVHIYEDNDKKNPKRYILLGIFSLILIASGIFGYYYYTQRYNPYKEIHGGDRDIFTMEDLAQVYEENYKAESEKRADGDYKEEPISKYPSQLNKFLSDFNTKIYKIGVTKLGGYPMYAGSEDVNYIGESAYGHFAYFRNGLLVRYDRDVVKYDFSEPIEPYSNTLISLYDPTTEILTFVRPHEGSVQSFQVTYDQIIKNNKETLGIFYETMNRLGNKTPIYKTEKKDFYLVQSASMPGIIFHLDLENNRIDSFYWRLSENKPEIVRFLYFDVTEADLHYEIPEDYNEFGKYILENAP